MTHIRTRTDTAVNWTAWNGVLQKGERGHESDTRKSKTGDGVTLWNALSYEVTALPDSPALTGNPTAPTPAMADDDTSIATTEFVKNQGYAPLNSPTFSGNPTSPTPADADDDTSIATTGFVKNQDYVSASDVAALITAALLAQHPVGDLKFTTTNVNPGTYIGGTWVAWGAGRVPVGVDAAQTEFDSAEEIGGAKVNNLAHTHTGPSHTHTEADHQHDLSVSNNAALTGAGSRTNATTTGGKTNATSTGASGTGNTGSSGSTTQTNLQPYITCYMWKRTA